MRVKRHVLRYTDGTATVTVHFPNEDVVCINCRFCAYEQGAERFTCRLLASRPIITAPRYGIEGYCPLEFEGEE